MAWPSVAVAVGEVITAAQMNGLPVRLADSTLGGSAASIDLQSIPQIYAHLFLECYLRGDTAAASTSVILRLLNDYSASHDYQYLQGNGTTIPVNEAFGQTSIFAGYCPANTADANLFNATTIDIPHYANTANNKAVSIETAHKSGTGSLAMNIIVVAGFYRSSAAVTRVTILPAAGNFVAGSRVTLYGMP